MYVTSHLPHVAIGEFEGPFDLLLELARKKKLNISEVSLQHITDDFLAYIEHETITPEAQGDFLVVASTMLLLKVRSLLPSLTQEETEEVQELTERVRMYELYRAQADWMESAWNRSRLLSASFWAEHSSQQSAPNTMPTNLDRESLSQVMSAFVAALPAPVTPRAHMTRPGRSLQDLLQTLSERLSRVQELILQEHIKGTSREDAALSFLAVLEMAKHKEVQLQQEQPFGNLTVSRI